MSSAPKSLLIVGCGYVGLELVHELDSSWTVHALTRSDGRAAELAEQGVTPVVGDWLEIMPSDALPKVDHVLVAVPHRAVGELGEQTHCQGLENLTQALSASPPYRLTYLSTTGVFGECESEQVDEDTPPSPTRVGPQVALAGERWLAEHVDPASYVCIRLAGIYGAGRIPLAAKLLAGEPLAVPQAGYLNLAHVTDIASMLIQTMTQTTQRNVYVFSDGQPVLRSDFYQHMAELCGVLSPQFTEPAEDSRSRRATSKRVNPARLVRELGFEFTYPDYKSGLAQAIAAEIR